LLGPAYSLDVPGEPGPRALDYAAWERGDFGSAEWADPEMEYEYADGPSPGAWKGIGGMAEGFRDFLGAWEDWRVVADDYLELDGERVLVSFHFGQRRRYGEAANERDNPV
jgi:hypothetical protein